MGMSSLAQPCEVPLWGAAVVGSRPAAAAPGKGVSRQELQAGSVPAKTRVAQDGQGQEAACSWSGSHRCHSVQLGTGTLSGAGGEWPLGLQALACVSCFQAA